ncbi:MAG TPA: glycoside hydrolase family 172 protein [Candidatus Kryptonia bacterium]|nr:glycoside hydrolase family 172 protein [Candidatus Kryptonia bacterium]
MHNVIDPSLIDPSLDCRAVSFENPTGARAGGGTAHGGRKGAPSRRLAAGERVVLADLAGPGTLQHIWMTFPPAPPEIMRALWLEVFYDGANEPSISLPCLDFFALPHGRPVAFDSAMVSVHEGRGFNSYFPMPFRRGVRVEVVNGGARPLLLYYQIDYTLAPIAAESGYLHVSFRRENPTVQRRDFVIADGLTGPGRWLGCAVGVRVIDPGFWYGEGEVKIYRDGDEGQPTICGTGLEDYVGTAWGMGPHATFYAGAPLVVRAPHSHANPDFVGFYRWHLVDPIMFTRSARVTIQQIGYALFSAGQEGEFEKYQRTNPAAGAGWERNPSPGIVARGIAERVDDYCATAYAYCREPQPVPRLDLAGALADIARRPYEPPHPFEALLAQ